jgi:c-di-GMP-related signal transduction protein
MVCQFLGQRYLAIACYFGVIQFSPRLPINGVVTARMRTAPQYSTGLRFVARQPIFDGAEKVFGYELLFRDGLENYFQHTDADVAARITLDSSLLLGLDLLCDGRRAFVNCTRDVLIGEYVTLLPSNLTVVEVLETVGADQMVIDACSRLKEAGYMIALDDFTMDDPRQPLTELADIIKVDLKQTSTQQRAALVQRYGSSRCRMLAERVETREQFVAARQQGFVYFQGYFFRQPEVMTTREIPVNRINYLRMLQAVAQPDLNLHEIEKIIKGEASLCYRLLLYLNSGLFGFSGEIKSVQHALLMMGENEIRRWVRLVAAEGGGQEKSSELVFSALVRARFCELLAPRVDHGGSDLFFMGLLSLMDAILEVPMSIITEKVPLDQETKTVLLGGANRLRPIYQLMLAQESGEWQESSGLAARLHLSETLVAESYWNAMQWARQVTSVT